MVAKFKFSMDDTGSKFLKGIAEGIKNRDATARQASQILKQSINQSIRTTFKERSGKLEKSFKTSVRNLKNGSVKVSVSSRADYAGIHETGGTIRPSKAQSLAVPISPAAKANKRGPRNFGPKLFRNKAGTALLQRVGKGSRPILHYALKKEVRIPKRPYVTKAARMAFRQITGKTTQRLDRIVSKAAGKAR